MPELITTIFSMKHHWGKAILIDINESCLTHWDRGACPKNGNLAKILLDDAALPGQAKWIKTKFDLKHNWLR